ncbi:MAG: GntR family transcriptional regulator [bacterium]|nr:GntR family transcriptional regulator [Candidatus Colisoma equi]
MLKDNTNYKRVYEALKKEILDGKYSSGRSFPSSIALAQRFGIARFSIRQALDILTKEGLIRSQRGRGTFVTKMGSNRLIGLIVPGVAVSEFFQPVASTLIRLARKNDYSILFGETYSKDPATRVHEARELAAEMIRNHVAGVLYQPFEATMNGKEMNRRILSVLDAKKIPVVLLDRDAVMPPERTAHDLVAVNNVDAGERLARHMVAMGARRIAFLTKFADVPNIECRVRGFLCAKSALERKGLRFEILRVAADDIAFFRRKMRGRARPDAIVCDSDTTAAVLLQTLGQIGCTVPDDVLVSGFDDVGIAKLTMPRLTTIHQPCTAIGEQAFRRLLARIANPDQASMEILRQAPLVVRESTTRCLKSTKKGTKKRR